MRNAGKVQGGSEQEGATITNPFNASKSFSPVMLV
jgi:hypothetical protein